MEAVSNVLMERFIALLFGVSMGTFASWIAWKQGYYVLPAEAPQKKETTGLIVFGAFILYFFCQIFAGSILSALWVYWQQGSLTDLTTFSFSTEFKGWANLAVYLLICAALIIYFAALDKPIREAVWGSPSEIRNWRQNIKDFFIGSLSWPIAFPWVIVVGQFLAILFALFYTGSLPDQAAVQHLKEILSHPWLFGGTALIIVTLVPFSEELLFRGFLQSWLKPWLGRNYAILLTALIFASFHFSMSQGIENIEFISSLFLLSCFLGFVKERQKSLWASIGLHSTFNFMSILMLIFEDGK